MTDLNGSEGFSHRPYNARLMNNALDGMRDLERVTEREIVGFQ